MTTIYTPPTCEACSQDLTLAPGARAYCGRCTPILGNATFVVPEAPEPEVELRYRTRLKTGKLRISKELSVGAEPFYAAIYRKAVLVRAGRLVDITAIHVLRAEAVKNAKREWLRRVGAPSRIREQAKPISFSIAGTRTGRLSSAHPHTSNPPRFDRSTTDYVTPASPEAVLEAARMKALIQEHVKAGDLDAAHELIRHEMTTNDKIAAFGVEAAARDYATADAGRTVQLAKRITQHRRAPAMVEEPSREWLKPLLFWPIDMTEAALMLHAIWETAGAAVRWTKGSRREFIKLRREIDRAIPGLPHVPYVRSDSDHDRWCARVRRAHITITDANEWIGHLWRRLLHALPRSIAHHIAGIWDNLPGSREQTQFWASLGVPETFAQNGTERSLIAQIIVARADEIMKGELIMLTTTFTTGKLTPF
jgi:hypothetical protein